MEFPFFSSCRNAKRKRHGVAQGCVPEVCSASRKDEFVACGEKKKESEKVREENDGETAEEKTREEEEVKVDKANGHFVKFVEQETTRITARVLFADFVLSAIILRLADRNRREGRPMRLRAARYRVRKSPRILELSLPTTFRDINFLI